MFCCFCHSSMKLLLWNIAFLYKFAATKFCYVQFLIWCFNKTNNVRGYLCNTSWSKLLIQNNTVKTTVKTTQKKQHSQHSQNNTVKTSQHYRPSTHIRLSHSSSSCVSYGISEVTTKIPYKREWELHSEFPPFGHFLRITKNIGYLLNITFIFPRQWDLSNMNVILRI